MSPINPITGNVHRVQVVTPTEAPKITIGVDFGTSTTKCVLNFERANRGRGRFVAVAFKNFERNGTLCLPTSIGVKGRELFFGFRAEALPEKMVIRSFKMAIPAIGREWRTYRSSMMIAETPGHFRLADVKLSASDLAALYLANVLAELSTRIGPVPYVNLAAPMDQLASYYAFAQEIDQESRAMMQLVNQSRDTFISQEYVKIGQRALALAPEAKNPWDLSDAYSALTRVNSLPVLPFKNSPAYVIPETLAAITEYVSRPDTEAGKYMTYDVGAGSTDASMFWLEKHDGVIKPWYYSSSSLHLGMDDIDRHLAELINQQPGGSLRERREQFEAAAGGLTAYRHMVAPVLDTLRQHRRRNVFGRAYAKETDQRAWEMHPAYGEKHAKVTALLIGGGCRTDLVAEIAGECLASNLVGKPYVESLQPKAIESVLLPSGHEIAVSEVEELKDQIPLLVIAEGLAHRAIDIPEWGFSPTRHVNRPEAAIEYGDHRYGHWW